MFKSLRFAVGFGLLALITGLFISDLEKNKLYSIENFSDSLNNTESIYHRMVQANNGIRGEVNGITVEVYEYETKDLLDKYFPFVSDDTYTVCTKNNVAILIYEPNLDCIKNVYQN